MSKLKIAHITEAPLGGVLSYIQEIVAFQLASNLVERVYVLAPVENIAALEHLRHPKLTLKGFTRPTRSWRGLQVLSAGANALLAEARPDIMHLHSSIAGLIRPALSKASHATEIVYSPHGWAFLRIGEPWNWLIRLVEAALSRFTDHIVCVSKFENREAARSMVELRKCMVIENGLKPLPDDIVEGMIAARRARTGPLKILFIGRFDRQKGFDVFIEAMGELGETAQATAVGGYLLSCEPLPKAPANVRIVGWQPQSALAAYYADADLLVMPSRWEGMPFVALEGMRAGLPIFASRIGGLTEVVVDGATGVCFEIDEPSSVSALIANATRDELAEMGKRGLARFKALFTAERMNHTLMEFYRYAAEQRTRARNAAVADKLRKRLRRGAAVVGAKRSVR